MIEIMDSYPDHRVCLPCACKDVNHCHRKLIAEKFIEIYGADVTEVVRLEAMLGQFPISEASENDTTLSRTAMTLAVCSILTHPISLKLLATSPCPKSIKMKSIPYSGKPVIPSGVL